MYYLVVKIVDINIETIFYWKHKILNCISTYLGAVSVNGGIKADEVFFAESFKWTKPSKILKKLINGKQVKKRCISKAQVCVATKYISNYLYYFKWLQTFSTEKEILRAKNFLLQSNVTYYYTKVIDFKERQPIYVQLIHLVKIMV